MAADVAPTPTTPLLVLRRVWQRLLGPLANPLASKEMLARMRSPRTFVIATTGTCSSDSWQPDYLH